MGNCIYNRTSEVLNSSLYDSNVNTLIFESITHLVLMKYSCLADEIYKKPVIIYNYPKQVKPFYIRLNDDGRTVAAFDMVVPKVS